jgi:hypothetical protein
MPAHAAAQWGWMNDTPEKKLSRSHLLDPARFGLPALNTEDLFQQRLKFNHAKELEALRNKFSQTPGQLDQLLSKNPEVIQKLLKNFRLEDLPAQLRGEFAGKEADFEKIIQSMTLRDFLKKYASSAEGLNALRNPGEAPAEDRPSAPPPTSTDKHAPPDEPKEPSKDEGTTQGTGVSETNAEEPSANSVWGRWLLEAAERFKDLDPALRNSPALRRALRDLGRKIDGVDEQWQHLDKGANALAEKWASLSQALPLHRLWPENGFSWARSLTPESLPKWRWPQGRPPFDRSALSLPQPDPSTIIPGDGWRSIGVLVILAALALLLWKVLRGDAAGASGQRTSIWKLGPWPVDPAGVRTREELIRAFEYLSVLRLGPTARHWHHWAIALGLGGSASHTRPVNGWGDPLAERRRAAKELASLYERARYAPPGDGLSESALATARRDLCLLAGVPEL